MLMSWGSDGDKHSGVVHVEKSGSAESQSADTVGDSSESRARMLVMIRLTAEPAASADALLSASIDQSAASTSAGTCHHQFTMTTM